MGPKYVARNMKDYPHLHMLTSGNGELDQLHVSRYFFRQTTPPRIKHIALLQSIDPAIQGGSQVLVFQLVAINGLTLRDLSHNGEHLLS